MERKQCANTQLYPKKMITHKISQYYSISFLQTTILCWFISWEESHIFICNCWGTG